MLDTNALNAPNTVKVEIVSISGADPHDVAVGTTIKELKQRYNLTGMRLIDENNDVLGDNYVINGEKQIFVSAPKRNGK